MGTGGQPYYVSGARSRNWAVCWRLSGEAGRDGASRMAWCSPYQAGFCRVRGGAFDEEIPKPWRGQRPRGPAQGLLSRYPTLWPRVNTRSVPRARTTRTVSASIHPRAGHPSESGRQMTFVLSPVESAVSRAVSACRDSCLFAKTFSVVVARWSGRFRLQSRRSGGWVQWTSVPALAAAPLLRGAYGRRIPRRKRVYGE